MLGGYVPFIPGACSGGGPAFTELPSRLAVRCKIFTLQHRTPFKPNVETMEIYANHIQTLYKHRSISQFDYQFSYRCVICSFVFSWTGKCENKTSHWYLAGHDLEILKAFCLPLAPERSALNYVNPRWYAVVMLLRGKDKTHLQLC